MTDRTRDVAAFVWDARFVGVLWTLLAVWADLAGRPQRAVVFALLAVAMAVFAVTNAVENKATVEIRTCTHQDQR